MLIDWLVGKILDVSFDKVNRYLTNVDAKLVTSKEDIEVFLSEHQKSVENWCSEINFADLKVPRHTMKVYVNLDVYLIPRRLAVDPNEKLTSKPLNKVLSNSSNHMVILGQPGAGKTTSMKYVCHRLITEENFLPKQNFPLVLRLRELKSITNEKDSRQESKSSLIIPAIAQKIGFKFKYKNQYKQVEKNDIENSAVMTFLEELSPLIILDGFDEINSHSARETVIVEIRSMARQFKKAKIILTSRTGEFPYQIDNTSLFEISALSKKQIRIFIRKWLGNDTDCDNFIEKIKRSPYADTALKPLTLAHLCALYERIGDIPSKPKTVYRKVVQLLIEEWDEQRSVRRQSDYLDFTPDRKFEFLSHLSFLLTTKLKGNIFSDSNLLLIFSTICSNYDLSPKSSKDVFREIESHTGLFLKAGYERYEFVHRSLQEYLAAEYIVRLPTLPERHRVIETIPNELAIAITISFDPSSYFSALVLTRLKDMNLSYEFYSAFISRLLQEKPEFNKNPDVVLALLTLYTSYLGVGEIGQKGIQLPLFIIDKLTSEFEAFMKGLAKRNSLKSIFSMYSKTGKQFTGFGDEVLILSRNENIRFSKNRIQNEKFCKNAPKFLYTRETFLEIFSK